MPRRTAAFCLLALWVGLVLCVGPVQAKTHSSQKNEVQAQGEHGRALVQAKDAEAPSGYDRWKMKLSFWPRKAVVLVELALAILIGIVIGQMIEAAGWVRWLAKLTKPLTRLGRLPDAAGPAFIMAFQSGAAANSMLVAARDQGTLNRRHLYTSVLVVSCLSLFAHLPTFIVPIGTAFGWEAACALFGVRFSAVVLEILCILAVSSWLGQGKDSAAVQGIKDAEGPEKEEGVKVRDFWKKVFTRSKRTAVRLMIYLIPTFAFMAWLEQIRFFDQVAEAMPGIFRFSFLPPESLAVIPAQAVSLYNGAIVAANFVDAGRISVHQTVLMLIAGSILTAPIRTLKHALPTYLAILGARPGLILSVGAQVLRVFFLVLCTLGLMAVWR